MGRASWWPRSTPTATCSPASPITIPTARWPTATTARLRRCACTSSSAPGAWAAGLTARRSWRPAGPTSNTPSATPIAGDRAAVRREVPEPPSISPASISRSTSPGARALFTTRRGGFSSGPYAQLNLGRWTDDDPGGGAQPRPLADQVGGRLAYGRQVHGNAYARGGPAGRGARAPMRDGQATSRRGSRRWRWAPTACRSRSRAAARSRSSTPAGGVSRAA